MRPSTVSGIAMVPGDKSISHRALMVAALADGTSKISNLAAGADIESTAGCLGTLGVSIERSNGIAIVAGGSLRESRGELDAGNSGTTMRLMAGILAGQAFPATITGDESLRRRPMKRIVEPLKAMGATVSSKDGCAPLKIRGGNLHGITYDVPLPSAQVKSCLLFAGLSADSPTVIREGFPTRDHTERLFAHAGVTVQRTRGRVLIEPGRPRPFKISVPGDFSSAAILWSAAALTGGHVSLSDVGLNPTRTGFLRLIERMGCDIEIESRYRWGREPMCEATVTGREMRGIQIGADEAPGCIDELPLIALLATAAQGTTRVTGATELRVKESDRIAAIVGELQKLGADIIELPDGFEVKGGRRLRGATCDGHGDHRIAMMLALAGLVASGETIVEGAESAAISYPTFAQAIDRLGADIDEG